MAPKHRKKTDQPIVDEEVVDATKDAVNLGDASALKRLLDESVVEALRQETCSIQHWMVDLKIGLGTLACAVACAAQFWPGSHTDNFWLLACCVASYAVLSLVMTALAVLVERDTIAVTRRSGGHPAIRVGSQLPRHSDLYTLRIAPRSSRDPKAGVAFARSVGDFFHVDGHLAVDVINAATKKLLQQYEQEASKSK